MHGAAVSVMRAEGVPGGLCGLAYVSVHQRSEPRLPCNCEQDLSLVRLSRASISHPKACSYPPCHVPQLSPEMHRLFWDEAEGEVTLKLFCKNAMYNLACIETWLGQRIGKKREREAENGSEIKLNLKKKKNLLENYLH